MVDNLKKVIPWPFVAEILFASLFALAGFLARDVYARTWNNEQAIARVMQELAGIRSEQTLTQSMINRLDVTFGNGIAALRSDLTDHMRDSQRGR
jgi:hypothetical protein